MGYQPDPDLRALVAYRHRSRESREAPVLAYLTHSAERWSWRSSPAHAQFFAGACARAPQLGYKLEHFWGGEPGLRDQRMSEILAARGISGLIFASYLSGGAPTAEFDWRRFCAVKIDFLPRAPALHNVTNDQRSIVQLAMRQMIAAGYRRIGFVAPHWWDQFVDLAWSAGFLAEQAQLPPGDRVPPLIYAADQGGLPPPNPSHFGVPTAEFQAWFAAHRPDGLLSYRPFVAPALAALGLGIPRDFAFVDFFLEQFDGRTAGVRHNCARVGELAVEIVSNLLQQHSYGIPEFQTTTLVEGTWIEGASLPRRVVPAPRTGREATVVPR